MPARDRFRAGGALAGSTTPTPPVQEGTSVTAAFGVPAGQKGSFEPGPSSLFLNRRGVLHRDVPSTSFLDGAAGVGDDIETACLKSSPRSASMLIYEVPPNYKMHGRV